VGEKTAGKKKKGTIWGGVFTRGASFSNIRGWSLRERVARRVIEEKECTLLVPGEKKGLAPTRWGQKGGGRLLTFPVGEEKEELVFFDGQRNGSFEWRD